MKSLKLLTIALLTTLFLTAPGFHSAPVAKPAEQNTGSQTPTGYPTGTICPRTGTYRAANQYLENIVVVSKGQAFPAFSDGSKTIWYPLTKRD